MSRRRTVNRTTDGPRIGLRLALIALTVVAGTTIGLVIAPLVTDGDPLALVIEAGQDGSDTSDSNTSDSDTATDDAESEDTESGDSKSEDSDSSDTDDSESNKSETSEVRIATLTDEAEFNGDLDFGENRELQATGSGTITWLPEPGVVLKPGDVLWEIDSRPTIYLQGEIPMYRELSQGVSKDDDVIQLEQALADAGYGPEGWEPNQTFNSVTRKAVRAFQEDNGLRKTGKLDAVQIVYGTEQLRVADTANLGARADAGAVLTVTTPEATVTVETFSRQLKTLQESPDVIVELADGSEFSAKLKATEATPAGEDGSFGYRVTYNVDGAVDQVQPVKVKIVRILAEDALTVPVDALLALAEGGYAVEKMTDDGPVLRGVEVIDFDNSTVAVTGNLEPGDQVVVP